jgi:hypothetical protein
MTNAEIEATVEELSRDQKCWLYRYLEKQLPELKGSEAIAKRQSVLDIAPVHLGQPLLPFTGSDDLLDEMLESRS